MTKKNFKNVPKRHVIYIDIDEEITSIFARVEKTKIKEIFLVVPNRAVILQTAINFKILKKKIEEIGKNLSIITHDDNAMRLAAQAEIPVYQNIEDEEPLEDEEEEEEDIGLSISPIAATGNELDESGPRRISRKKMSIADILNRRRTVARRQEPEQSKPQKKNKIRKKESQPKEENPAMAELRPSRRTIFTLIGASIILFIIIGYIALPGATIFITPKSAVLTASTNIIFADSNKNVTLLKNKNKNAVATFPIAKNVTYTGTYSSTGKNFEGSNATGIITIYNSEARTWPLVEKTRFQSPDGIVYRITSAVEVPPAGASGPGTVEAQVEADPLDAFERVVGERGNIGPTKFFLPGLRESSREKLYAESKTAFTGGATKVTPKVLAEDLEAARKFVEEELEKKVLSEMLSEVDNYNTIHNTKLSLLTGDKAINFGDVRVTIPRGIEGKELAEFEVSGEIPIKAVMYDHSAFLNLLTQELERTQSPDKKLVKIENDSLQYKIFEIDSLVSQLKTTASIKAIEEYSIDAKSDAGLKLLRKIKERVVGLTIEEAQNKIQNLPEVHTVEIKSWPMWAPKMPSMVENIDVEIVSN